MHIADVAFVECSFAVRQVVIPHVHEAIVESELAHLGEMFEKSAAPFVKGQSVVLPDVFHVKKLHAGGSGQRSLNLDDRSQLGSGKDVLLDPVALLSVLLKLCFQDGDGLQQHAAVRLEQAITGSEVVVVMFIAHGFEHFNADDLVVLPAQVAVVFEQQLDALPRPAPREHFTRVVVLLAADGRGGYAATVSLGRVCREAAPAGADFEHVVLRSQLEFPADAIELADLCLLQSIVGAFVISARVGQAAVQEEAIEVVAQVVVIRDIATAAGLRVTAAAMLDKVSEPAEGRQGADCCRPVGPGFAPPTGQPRPDQE